MQPWILSGVRKFRLALVCAVLWPAAAHAGPALSPAPSVPPTEGMVLDYGKWRCEIANPLEFGHGCIQGDRSARFYAWFFIIGPADRDGYGMSQTEIWCPGVRNGDFRRSPPLVLRDKARRAARSLWPLKSGKKIHLIAHVDQGRERIDLSVRVHEPEAISWNGQTRNVFRVSATEEFKCNNLPGEWSLDLEPPAEYVMTWWYDPAQRLILKMRRDWPNLAVTENLELRRVQMPASAQIARPRPTAPATPKIVQDHEPSRTAAPRAVTADCGVVFFKGRVRDASWIIELTVNGRPVAVEADGSFTARRGAPRGRSTIIITALDEWGNRGSWHIRVTREAAVPVAAASRPETPSPKIEKFPDIHFGKYHSLIIGNNRYAKLNQLKTAIHDAKAVADSLSDKYGFVINLLLNATRGNLISALAKLRAKLTLNDNLLIYYAGHGELDKVTRQGYWLPVDADPNLVELNGYPIDLM